MLGETKAKIWGQTRPLFLLNNVEIHRIETHIKGASCSVHKHDHKYNYFFVESGKLKIKVWQNDYDLIDETTLEPGQYITVAPGVFHQFFVVEPGVAFEIYYVKLLEDDIVRKTVGSLS